MLRVLRLVRVRVGSTGHGLKPTPGNCYRKTNKIIKETPIQSSGFRIGLELRVTARGRAIG